MRTLKDLTQEECVKIASIAEPNVDWKFIQSHSKWKGFDLVEKHYNREEIAKHIFQINYERNEFRIYKDLNEYTPSIEPILNYLCSIGVGIS